MTNIQVYDDTAERLEKLAEKYDTYVTELIDTLLDEGEEILDDIYLHESLKEDIDFTSFKKELKDTIPAKDIDTYRSDLYVRITPETTALIKKYGIYKSTMLNKFRDNIDNDLWYELPFVNIDEFIAKEKEETKKEVELIKSLSKKEELNEETIEQRRERVFGDLDYIANKLYDERDEEGFLDFSDDELALLWANCMLSKENPYGKPYDDEVYEAIKEKEYQSGKYHEIFDKAEEIYQAHFTPWDFPKDESLKENKEDVEYKKVYYATKKADGTNEIEFYEIEEPVHMKDKHLGGRNKKVLTKDEWQRRQGLKESRDYAKEDEDRKSFSDWLYDTNRLQTAWDWYFADEEGNDAEEILNTLIEDYLNKSFVKDEISEEEEEYWKRIARLAINEIGYYNFNKDDMNESCKESLKESLTNDERKEALAKYLDVPTESIEDGYREYVFATKDGEEYFVVDAGEAWDLAKEDVYNFIDELGISGFTKEFQEWILDNAVKKDWFEYAVDESNDAYVADITEEEAYDDKYPSRLVEEAVEANIFSAEEGEKFDMNNKDLVYELQDEYKTYLNDQIEDPIQYYRDNFGEESFEEVVTENGLIDEYAIAERAIDLDGVEQFLASYDGKEIELDNNLFAYRI